ncbi:MAG: hypothetical protein OEM82_04005, partial [Acidobacteriota bacterium]|nr:hypothetical protein [Acidobacteriota bacterium]
MNTKIPFFLVAIFALSGFAFGSTNLTKLAQQAVVGNDIESAEAIRSLRSKKQAGLDAVFATYGGDIDAYRTSGVRSQNWERITFVLDQVAMQKDAYSSRLFWHTDLAEAMREAKIRNKKIVSLRLLGDLNDEYSCANSRLFRSILYSDPAVAKTLRKDYVLHWKSVRPAPKITIDFGDGRKLVRTITGNSIHYILSSSGRIIDALPGLYDPATFGRYLAEAGVLETQEFAEFRTFDIYRLRKGKALVEDWDRRMKLLGRDTRNRPSQERDVVVPETGRLGALPAMLRTVTKSAIEAPAVLALMPQIELLRKNTEIDDWKTLADVGEPVQFRKESIALIRSKSGDISDYEF